MIRRMDFRCQRHGYFEASESLHAPVSQTWPCPECGEQSAKVYLKAPMIGKISSGQFVVDFPGGHTLLRDDVEERISRPEPAPFENDPGFAERIVDRAIEKAYRREQGQLPQVAPAAPSESEQKVVEAALAKAGMTV